MMRRLLISISLLTFGCAYSYAGQDGKTREEGRIRQDVKVVELKKKDDDKSKSLKPIQTSKAGDSPCGIPKFSIHFYEKGSRVEKIIDCKKREVLEVKRGTIENAVFEDARTSNIPAKTWYFLVDPYGSGQTELNNDHLIKLSREFQIEFFGRHEKKNLLIYTFLESL